VVALTAALEYFGVEIAVTMGLTVLPNLHLGLLLRLNMILC
jgi:hypothetical protein